MLQAAEEARGALSAEQSKTLKLEAQVAELTEKLNSVQVGLGACHPWAAVAVPAISLGAHPKCCQPAVQ